MSYIEVKQCSKIIKGKIILDNINLQLEKGKIYGFVGKNGSGKTMLFRAICGLIKPSQGLISINGEVLHKDISFPRNVGVIIESPGFWDELTGYENLELLSKIKGLIGEKEIRHAIERVGLKHDDSRIYKKYSLGMKQRLAIAQAIMESPDLLILDEPTNGLDEEGVDLIRKIILEENQRGSTVLITSHNKEDISILAEKIYRVIDGKLTDEVKKP
ncbi:ATP-binding cassette domain-containing protein [Garciella nitratireducens]|uniref:ABC-2 type transport system ATP-binding protein n=1 Tax=Garciella nitratireducens DSM 15102 TaxID=1121911 RepID=A0A1T4LXY6_9FIRM|nr:ATP-binding cassette domain-containing protein [Garciella nitratireducens]RBP44142.1 ABC-2 type transport system ATP-binding protein [Garciella nitratireducens]SJZ59388.1 ABC-2 type transport system ATP-binding protein [Garciella nitratireducens DSM 15102]